MAPVGRQGMPELRRQARDENFVLQHLVRGGRKGLPIPESFVCARHLAECLLVGVTNPDMPQCQADFFSG